ncbi:MAG: MerR family transcriptional regulator [Paracoccaceae bacterium]
MSKSPDAFRTISEVAELLETPAHVLRFWESRFPQIRPVKRAGGRRYYRPADVALLTGIKRLLHDDGLTIRGVQKILREQGVRHVSGVADDGAEAEGDDLASTLAKATGTPKRAGAPPLVEAETAQIIALQAALRPPEAESMPQDESEAVGPAIWQDDPAPDVYGPVSLPADDAPVVADPPPPVTSAPVVADLFARAAPPHPPQPPVAEAPMAIWADDSDVAEDVASQDNAPDHTVTRIGREAAPPPEADVPAPLPAVPVVSTAPPAMAEAPAMTGPTLAQRLRALSETDLTPGDRQRLSEIHAQALALRARLSGPARASL